MLEQERIAGSDDQPAAPGPPERLTENLTSGFLDFLQDVSKHNVWQRLREEHPELEPYLVFYISTKTSFRDLAIATKTALPQARQSVLDAVSALHGFLPPEARDRHGMEEILRIRKNGRTKGTRALTIKPEKDTLGINSLTMAARRPVDKKLIAERTNEARAREKATEERAKRFRDGAYDMDEDERNANPVKGAKYNLILAERYLPKSLIDFFRNHPGIEVEDWKNIHARLFGGSYITFTRGSFVYIGPDIRLPLTPEYLDILADEESDSPDPENVRRFGLPRFKNVKAAIELCALRNGYRIFKAS